MPADKLVSEQFELLLQNHNFSPNKIARFLTKICKEDINQLQIYLNKIPKYYRAKVILLLEQPLFEKLVTQLQLQELAQAISYLQSNKANDFIQRLQRTAPKTYEQIFPLLPQKQQEQIRFLSRYNPEEAGAYMQTELLQVSPNEHITSLKQKIKHFRHHQPQIPLIKIFVCDEEKHLLATLHFADTMLFKNRNTFEDIINALHPSKPLFINEHTHVQEVITMFQDFKLDAIAVVDENKELIGRIVYDDIYELILLEEESQSYKMAGAHPVAEEKSLLHAQRYRLKWIFINLCAILISASIINMFKDTIHQMVALAVLMPIVAALGGNVGNQAITVTVRRLALGETSWQYTKKIFFKELFIGIANGIIVGLVVGALAFLWFSMPLLGVVIGLAIILNLSMAGLLGSLIPLAFKHLGSDPAIVSPLLLTTATDAMGFFIFLGLAKLMLF